MSTSPLLESGWAGSLTTLTNRTWWSDLVLVSGPRPLATSSLPIYPLSTSSILQHLLLELSHHADFMLSYMKKPHNMQGLWTTIQLSSQHQLQAISMSVQIHCLFFTCVFHKISFNKYLWYTLSEREECVYTIWDYF